MMMKIIKTNWVNIVGVFIILFLYTFLNSWINHPATFVQSLLGAFVLICLYGMIFWLGFIAILIVLDFLLIIPKPKNSKLNLLIEWIIISFPFVYWAIKYPEQRTLYIIAIVTFLATQLLRDKLINKAIN